MVTSPDTPVVSARFAPWCLVLAMLLCLGPGTAIASDALRSEGMGGSVVGLRSADAGTRINPAALVREPANHLAFYLSTSGWNYDDLGETDEARFSAELAGQVQPSFYYAHTHDRFGLSLGYRADFSNNLGLSLLETQSTYFVNEQRFEAQTDLALLYDSLWERAWFLSVGYQLQAADVGLRLKRIQQTAKQGELIPSLYLYAQLEDVNPNKADEVIPAIMDGLEYEEDRIQHPVDRAVRDLTVGAWDFDVGLQTNWLGEYVGTSGLTAGVLFRNLLQRRRVTAYPMHLSMGVYWEATPWANVAADVGKRFGDAGPDLQLGWEIHTAWERHAIGGVALRNGWSRRDGTSRITLGLELRLGSASWEYAFSKRTSGETLTEARHLLASTIAF